MPELPLFPLGTVLFPGLVLPLHVFEERYRLMVRELLEARGDRGSFGVVAIRAGHEVGADAVSAMYDVGCRADIRQVTQYDDGRYDLLGTGGRRFRLRSVSTVRPYLVGDVEWLGEEVGDNATILAAAAAHAFRGYQRLVAGQDADTGQELPGDPLVLSYLIAAALVLDVADKHRLLAAPDAARRLRLARGLLRRETALLRSLRALPAVDLLRGVAISPS
jgi:uncharacterized protein